MIKKALGGNIALMVFASSLIQPPTTIESEDTSLVVQTRVVMSTEKTAQQPVKNVRITQSYRFYHRGIDLDGSTGDPINPIMPGKVVGIEVSKFGYGKSVLISHGNGRESLYAHLSKIEVQIGQEVTKETKIGEMGSTGRSSGDHLHLEVHENGKAINPLTIID